LEIHCIPEIICERVFSHKTDSPFRRVSFSPDNKFVATSSESNYIDIYNAIDGGQAFKVKCCFSQELLSWHPKRNILAYIDE
jgi:WD40 repeat protein